MVEHVACGVMSRPSLGKGTAFTQTHLSVSLIFLTCLCMCGMMHAWLYVCRHMRVHMLVEAQDRCQESSLNHYLFWEAGSLNMTSLASKLASGFTCLCSFPVLELWVAHHEHIAFSWVLRICILLLVFA